MQGGRQGRLVHYLSCADRLGTDISLQTQKLQLSIMILPYLIPSKTPTRARVVVMAPNFTESALATRWHACLLVSDHLCAPFLSVSEITATRGAKYHPCFEMFVAPDLSQSLERSFEDMGHQDAHAVTADKRKEADEEDEVKRSCSSSAWAHGAAATIADWTAQSRYQADRFRCGEATSNGENKRDTDTLPLTCIR